MRPSLALIVYYLCCILIFPVCNKFLVHFRIGCNAIMITIISHYRVSEISKSSVE